MCEDNCDCDLAALNEELLLTRNKVFTCYVGGQSKWNNTMKDAEEGRKRPSAASPGSTSDIVSHPVTLGGAVVICAVWTLFGALERFPTQWFILANIVGTLGAFLMILLIQSAKARETLAVQAKLDQLILSSEAGNHWIGVERHEAEVIEEMRLRHHSQTSA